MAGAIRVRDSARRRPDGQFTMPLADMVNKRARRLFYLS